MLYNGNHRLSSEESVPLALALFDRAESDLKATKAEKTAVAFREYWQVATTALQGKFVLCNSCVRAASLKVTISQDRTSHLCRDQVRCKHTSPLIHKSIIRVPGVALGKAPIAFPCKENETHGNIFFFSLSSITLCPGTPSDMYFFTQHMPLQISWAGSIHKRC